MSPRWITFAIFAGTALSLSACNKSAPPDGTEPVPSPGDAPAASVAAPRVPAKPPSTAPDEAAPGNPKVAKRSIGALKQDTYIFAEPSAGSAEIGALDIGGTAVLRETEPVSKKGCPEGWYAVEPKGFICNDRTTTLEPERHPLIQTKAKHAGQFDEGIPYHWGESRYAPLYRKLPDEKEQRRYEAALDKHLKRLEQLREARRSGASEDDVSTPADLRGVDIFPSTGEPPAFLANGVPSPWAVVHTPADGRSRYEMIPARSTIAWTDEFFAEGRSWLLTQQLLLVPKDKVAVQKPSPFVGVRLGENGHELPLAFMRTEDRTKYRLEGDVPSTAENGADDGAVVPAAWTAGAEFSEDPDDSRGRFVATEEKWKRLDWVGLTGRARWKRGKRYLETKDHGFWLRENDAVVFRGREPSGLELKEGEKWIDVSIHRGSLVAYEGRKPVFVTLISPGLKGYSRVNGKPAKNTTPTGAFRIEWKHLTQTMSPDPKKKTYYLSEVPYTQFFHMPFALHGAYWHDRFGEPKSGGCVNLSVADAKWLFGWTEPALPEGWHSIRSGDDRGEGTWVVVR